MRLLSVCLTLLSGLAWTTCLAAGNSTSGQVIARGAAPFSETWDRMVARDHFREPGGPERSTQVKAKPFPIVVRFRGPGGEEEAPRPAVGTDIPFAAPGPFAPQAVGSGFIGSNLLDEINTLGGYVPPDTMGAIGPNHFVITINSSIGVYNRAGTRLSHVSLDSFFAVTIGNTNYPENGTSDPRILFDRISNRWYSCIIEFGSPSGSNNNIILAVSRTSDPLTGIWDKYVIPVAIPRAGPTKFFNDFPTLGVDSNGVYFGMRVFPTTSADFAKIAATPLGPLIAASPSLGSVFQWSNIKDMFSSPQPAHNQNSISASARTWFVSSSTSSSGNVNYRTLTWSGGVPTLSSTSSVTTPGYATPLDAPANGSSVPINVGDDRLVMAMIRNNKLWTSRNVGLDSSGGGSSATRTGCEWLELDVSGATPTLVQSGRVYDNAASNPRYYYYPSVMVNGQGHMVLGFSGSKSTEFVGTYTCGRLASDSLGTTGAVTQLKAGQASYQRVDSFNRNRWGDYSFSSLDPQDDMTVWTIQEYASNLSTSIWSTWVNSLLSPVPTLNNPAASGCQGQTGKVINSTGTGFYDPGAGYANRLGIVLTGGSVNGISNYNVTYNSPTSVTVTFDIAAGATPGARDIVLTNPDGQSVTVVGGFTVLGSGIITAQPASIVRCLGQAAAFCVTATGTGLTYQWSKNGAPIQGATSSCYTIQFVVLADAGDYRCAITSGCGTINSNAGSLGVGTCSSVAQAKIASGSVALIGRVVTASFGDTFYVQEPAFPSGIRVHATGASLSIGAVVDLSGTVQTNTDMEKLVEAGVVVPEGTTGVVNPLGMSNRIVGGGNYPSPGIGQVGVTGGAGLHNIGLLIRTLGKFTYLNSSTFLIDDGSGVNITCVVPAGVTLNPAWQYVEVTGISSCANSGGMILRRILVRSQSDIAVVQ